jgi:uncharacterized protein YbjT (DUF2867 family)
MRVLVTGPQSPVGRTLVEAIAKAGHHVRAFGVPPGEKPFAGTPNVECYPGQVELGGSVEPVASEVQAVVHCSNLDEPGRDRKAHAIHIAKGTLYVGYAAQRELVDDYICLMPWSPGRWSEALRRAQEAAEAVRVPHAVVRVDPANLQPAIDEVLRRLSRITTIQYQDTASPAANPLPAPTP